MKSVRFLALLAILFQGVFSQAQLPTWDNVVASAKLAWKKTVDAGRPLAQQIARETPERFRIAKNQALSLVRQAEKFANSGDLQHKKEIAAELWRVRGSLDLMALLDPQTLKMFGIDVPDLAKLRSSVNRQLTKLRV